MSAAKSMDEALAAALLHLNTEPPENRLSVATFGRLADGTGYWWALQFFRNVLNGVVEDPGQDNGERARMVIRDWSQAQARLSQQAAADLGTGASS